MKLVSDFLDCNRFQFLNFFCSHFDCMNNLWLIACTVDHVVYKDGDPIPTDDPCETCKCRPPGFICMLQHCEIKTGCRAIRHVGECCPSYQCGMLVFVFIIMNNICVFLQDVNIMVNTIKMVNVYTMLKAHAIHAIVKAVLSPVH